MERNPNPINERVVTWLDSAAVTRVLKVIAIVSLLASLVVGYNQSRLTACLAAYNEASNKATAARTDAAQADREALDTMINAIAHAGSTPDPKATVNKALNDYLVSRARADGQRSGNPLPAPPSQTCG